MFPWDSALSVITVIIALWALHQTSVQIALSNKQHLFERRLKCLVFVNDFLNVLKKMKELKVDIAGLDNNLGDVQKKMMYMISNRFFYLLTFDLIQHTADAEVEKKFIAKLDEMELKTTEIDLIFPKLEGRFLSEFLRAYIKYLLALYYHLVFGGSGNSLSDIPIEFLRQVFQLRGEDLIRQEKSSLKALCAAYQAIETNKINEKIEEIIRLDSWGFWQRTLYRMKQFLSPVMNVIRKNGSKNNE